MYHFFYSVFFKFFTAIGWGGMLPDSAAFVMAVSCVLFVANFMFSLCTGYNPAIHFAKWVNKVYFD